MPERFLDAEGNLKPDYETSAFGFGRRGRILLRVISAFLESSNVVVCPGIPFAERTLWINIATMLWTFNIRGSDEIDPKTGRPFCYDDSDDMFTGDLTSCPRPFPAVFEPRSLQRAEIAKKEWDECEKDLNVLLPKPKEK
ncbi:hypothetical protein C0993_006199 [Termitomyces sp. T159_Od127]|nr:hypothetical protein C0993_006199 [Termitomyces sp. T159_Od127]